MQYLTLFYQILFWNVFVHAAHYDLHTNISVNNESGILANIVSNLLDKYYESDQIYLSIISSLRQYGEMYFLDDFISILFENHRLKNISFSFLISFDTSLQFRRVFNIIFISNHSSFTWVPSIT